MIGETISHYTVLGTLGRGGMGVVYKAEDVRLKRQVALKFLSDEKPFDHQMLERFRWEAQAASALNHPNICTIYDIDEAGGRPFIAMELLEGRSLRDVIVDDGAMDVEQVVAIGIQIADALSTAHASGIIHRDLKPANVFLTTRNQAKLLDFGLAKAVAHRAASVASELAMAETGSPIFQTNPGIAVGTAGYMAPEQIRDDEVDARTDVFALGIVLYELATGRPAFPGRTLGIVQDAVLNRAPQSPSEINPAIPPKLVEVIARCLEKDPDLRYQTAADLRGDLKRVLRDQSTQMMAVTSAETGWRRTPTPAPAPLSQAARARRARWLGLAALGAAGLGATLWLTVGRPPASIGPSPRLTPFTTLPGQLRQPAFSPEGSQIAFAWNGGDGETFSLYTQLIDAGAPLRLTTSPGEDGTPAWSPDGRFIAFLRRTPDEAGYFIVPALGGVERPVRASYGVPFSYGSSLGWSPDGTTIAMVDRERAGAPLNILLVDVAGGRVRPLLESPMPYLQNPTFTSDGQTLAFVGGRGFLAQDIYTVPVAGGTPRRLTTDASHIAGITWSADEREVIFSSNRGGLFSVWKVASSGGEPQLVTVGEDAYAPTLSRRGGHLAYLRLRLDWNLWRVPGPAAPVGGAAERLIFSTREEWQPEFSPDDRRIAFVSSRSGSQEIWVSDSDGSSAVQLTTFRGPPTGTPRWSPDGRRVVLDSRVGGDSEIFTVASDGSGLTRLTTEPSEDVVPSWSRDGRFIYFTSDRGGRPQIWKTAAAGGAAAVLVLDTPGRDVSESDDGRWLYFWRQGVWRVPAQGGPETRVAQHPKWGSWRLRGDSLYLLNEDARPRPTIDRVDLSTGARAVVRELDDFPRVRSFPAAFDLSHDGAWFVFGRVDQMQNDVMLIQHFR